MLHDEEVLECQQCGCVLKRLTPAEAQQVALRPHNFVMYCTSCARDHPGQM